MPTAFPIAENSPGPIGLHLNIGRASATFGEGDDLGIGKEGVVALGESILGDQNIKNIEVNFIEKISHNLVDKGRAFVCR